MERTINGMLKSYETGRLSRRDLVQGLALLTATTAQAQPTGFTGNGINHLSLYVSDLQRSSEFYQRAFNGKLRDKTDQEIRIAIGRSRIALRRGSPVGKVDHFAIGIDNFNQNAVIADLKARGAEPSTNADAGLHVLDPDGYPVQLSANDPA